MQSKRGVRVNLTAIVMLAGTMAGLGGCDAADPNNPFRVRPGKGEAILIVHGAWGGGWAFREVDSLLTADGYKVHRPTLTGQGEHVNLTSTNINLSTHIDDIVNHILFEDLHDVVLVGHSYGGMVITGVADRVPERIRKMIYVDAVLPNNGECVNDVLEPIGRLDPDGYIHPTWTVQPNPPHDVLMPAKTFSEKIVLKNEAVTAKIPSVYILTVDAGKQPSDDRFYKFYGRAKDRGWPVQVLANTDHNAQWSNPKGLVRMLEEDSK